MSRTLLQATTNSCRILAKEAFHATRCTLQPPRRCYTPTKEPQKPYKPSVAAAVSVGSAFHKYSPVMDAPPGVFRGSVDRFNGITIDSQSEAPSCTDFDQQLKDSLAHWKAGKRRAIWFNVHPDQSTWIPCLTQMGFQFHHVQEESLSMFRWLPTEEAVNIPTYAHTMLGVGGLVVNDKDELLVVSDRFALIPKSWKLPGGYVEPRENLVEAAIREVREETGIDSTFQTVVSLRHSHGGNFNCSDIYVVIALKPLNLDLKRCEREIASVRWMPIKEFLEHSKVHAGNRHFLLTYLKYQKLGIRFTCEEARHEVLKKEYRLYYMQPIKDDDAEGAAKEQAQAKEVKKEEKAASKDTP